MFSNELLHVAWKDHTQIWFSSTLILTADFIRLLDLGVLILTLDCCVYLVQTHLFWLLIFKFDIARTLGSTARQRMLYFFMTPDLTSDILRGPCTPILWFVFPIGLMRLITVHYFCHFLYHLHLVYSNTEIIWKSWFTTFAWFIGLVFNLH
jgi:hypothetical protein